VLRTLAGRSAVPLQQIFRPAHITLVLNEELIPSHASVSIQRNTPASFSHSFRSHATRRATNYAGTSMAAVGLLVCSSFRDADQWQLPIQTRTDWSQHLIKHANLQPKQNQHPPSKQIKSNQIKVKVKQPESTKPLTTTSSAQQ
jgi:hypothetical protein